MKIIKKGSLPEKRVHRATCNHCRCLYEFEECESRSEFSARNESFLITICPTCGRKVYTDATGLS